METVVVRPPVAAVDEDDRGEPWTARLRRVDVEDLVRIAAVAVGRGRLVTL